MVKSRLCKLPKGKAISAAMDKSAALQTVFCSVYLSDYWCLGYPLPEICEHVFG